MKILILGQPRSGKTTVASRIENKYKVPIYHTDILRKELGYGDVSTNNHIFATGIDIQHQKEFYDEIIKLLPNDYVLEGSAIYPCDVLYFKPDAVVMMSAAGRSLEEMFQDSRKYDTKDSYTRKRTDVELLKLFDIYKEFEENWYAKYRDIVPTAENMDFFSKLEEAEAIIDMQIRRENFNETSFGELIECFNIIPTPYSFADSSSVYRRNIGDGNDLCPEELYNDLRHTINRE